MTNLDRSNGKQTIPAKEKQLLDLVLDGKSDKLTSWRLTEEEFKFEPEF